MVFVWSQMTRGDPNYTLVQVSVNNLVMVVAFAPIVALLLGVTEIAIPWETLVLSVVLYIVLPLIAGWWTRKRLTAQGGEAAVSTSPRASSLSPCSACCSPWCCCSAFRVR